MPLKNAYRSIKAKVARILAAGSFIGLVGILGVIVAGFFGYWGISLTNKVLADDKTIRSLDTIMRNDTAMIVRLDSQVRQTNTILQEANRNFILTLKTALINLENKEREFSNRRRHVHEGFLGNGDKDSHVSFLQEDIIDLNDFRQNALIIDNDKLSKEINLKIDSANTLLLFFLKEAYSGYTTATQDDVKRSEMFQSYWNQSWTTDRQIVEFIKKKKNELYSKKEDKF